MNYTSIENDIVARLAPLVTAGYQVEAMPDRESDNIGVGHKGRVTVQVTMAKYGDHRSTPPAVVQEEDIYVDIILRARTLRALGGIYDLSELCRGLLIGFAPDNCRLPLSGIDFGSIAPAEYEGSVHMYSLRLKTQTISVGGPDVDVTPLITEITFDDQTTSGPAPSVELYASAYNVLTSGTQVILAWVTSGVGELFLSGVGIVEPIGTATVTITADITYTLSLTNGLTVTSDTVDIEIGFGDADYELYNTEGILLENGSIPSNEVSGITAPDATVLINGNQFDTVASGDAIDLPVVNGGSNPVGSEQAGEWVIGNSTVTINGTQVGDIVAEDSLPIAVELDGSPSGTWNAGTQTWEVTSAPCADATFSIDGTQVDTVASGADLDVSVELNGSPVTPTYNSGTKVIGVTGGVSGSISVAVSDATPNFGDTITITATPTNYTPTSYLFFAFDGSSVEFIAEQAGNAVNWSVTLLGAFDIYALGTDGATETFGTVSAMSTGDPDASAFIIAAGITDNTEKSAVTTLTLALKSASLYTKFIAVYPLLGGTANSHKYNLIDPQDTDLAHRLKFSGGWTHTSNGARGNASNTFANTHIIPNALLTSGSNSVGFYTRSNVSENKYDFACSTDAGAGLNPFGAISWYTFGSVAYDMSGNYNLSAAVGSAGGLTHGFGNAGTWRLYRNGAQIGSTASSVIALPNFALDLGGNNGGGTLSLVSSKEYAFAFVADQQMTPTDAANLYTIVQAYQTTLNRQV